MAQSQDKIDPLESARENDDAISAIMERYGVDGVTAAEMWQRFIDTVVKMREIARSRRGIE